jgi:hypothetical protein
MVFPNHDHPLHRCLRFKIAIAHNGAKPLKAQATGGEAKLEAHAAQGLGSLVLTAKENTDVKWSLQYE